MSGSRLVVIGVPGERRTEALRAAAGRAGLHALVLSWCEVLEEPSRVSSVARHGDHLRIESPGADEPTWRALAALGGDDRAVIAGQWRPGRCWFRGLTRFLAALEPHTAGLHCSHPSAQILAMTDKQLAHERLTEVGVPTPTTLPAARNADELRAVMTGAGRSAVYVKPRWGSSAAGVLAFRRTDRRERVTTTAHLEDGRLHNRKCLRHYEERASIDALLDAVLGDGAVVQRWLPKAGHASGPFDLRVVVLHGRIAQSIARIGRGTITNLHVQGRRIAVAAALAPYGADTQGRVEDVCRRAAACFPGHHSVGVDVMIDPRGRPWVLECNAWGDYLPGLLVDGKDSYDLYIAGLASRSVEA